MNRDSAFEYPATPDEGGGWLLSYADLITLLITFFILLLSVSTIQRNRFELLRTEFNEEAATVNDLTTVQKQLDAYISQTGLGETVSTTLDMDGLKLQFTNTVLFDSGRAEVTPAGRVILDKMSQSLVTLGSTYRLVVEGYTDDVPIHTAEFDSNWALSAGRAIQVLQALRTAGIDEKRLSVQGFADTRPAVPVAGEPDPAMDLEQRRAQNRRVVIRVY